MFRNPEYSSARKRPPHLPMQGSNALYREMGRWLFINPYTDFGFKKLFGTEANKDLLISFLVTTFCA